MIKFYHFVECLKDLAVIILLVVAAWLLYVISFAVAVNAAEPLTPRQAAELLDKSVVELAYKSPRRGYCTASMIGDNLWLTAGHCAKRGEIVVRKGFPYALVSNVTVGIGDKDPVPGRKAQAKDWALLRTYTALDEVEPLALGCDEEIYVGMPIAYMGYPVPLQRYFSVGIIGSLEQANDRANDSDVIVDLQAAPGASGSPVISLETGSVIGILTEGYFSRVGVIAVGVEHLSPELCGLVGQRVEATLPDEASDGMEIHSPF